MLLARIPSHRNDLQLPQDLTEEVARVYGYERIPTTEPGRCCGRAAARPAARRAGPDALAGVGLMEPMTFPFVRRGDRAASG